MFIIIFFLKNRIDEPCEAIGRYFKAERKYPTEACRAYIPLSASFKSKPVIFIVNHILPEWNRFAPGQIFHFTSYIFRHSESCRCV